MGDRHPPGHHPFHRPGGPSGGYAHHTRGVPATWTQSVGMVGTTATKCDLTDLSLSLSFLFLNFWKKQHLNLSLSVNERERERRKKEKRKTYCSC